MLQVMQRRVQGRVLAYCPPSPHFTFRTIEKHLILSIHFTVYWSFSGLYLNINKYIENPNKYCSLIWNVSPAARCSFALRRLFAIITRFIVGISTRAV